MISLPPTPRPDLTETQAHHHTAPRLHEVETARLYLRAFRPSDLDVFAAITSDPDVMRYIGEGGSISREDAQTGMCNIIRNFERRGFGRWAVVHKDDERLIGYCGLTILSDMVGVEVAYLLAKEYWRRGLATEAAHATLRYGFEELSLERIVGVTKIGNTASRRVMEKLGMRFVKQEDYFNFICVHYEIGRHDFRCGNAFYRLHNPARVPEAAAASSLLN